MEKEFDHILNKDEKILKILKPNKIKFFVSSFVISCLVMLWFVFMFIVGIVGDAFNLTAIIIGLCFFAVFIGLQIWLTSLAYTKRIYCITNQRIIIRCGVIGIDFKSLELSSIGAVDVYISLIDKIIKKNTGSIRFGSMSAPISNGSNSYNFSHIIMPYDVCREIKGLVFDSKIRNK